MAKRAPWFKCFPSDFLNGVSELTPNEIAVYTIVLMRIYDENGPIAHDIDRIARRCNMRPTSCEKALERLLEIEKLHVADGMLMNGKAEKLIESRQKVSEKSAHSARTSWQKRREKASKNNEGALRTHQNSDANEMLSRSYILEAREEPNGSSNARAEELAFAEWYGKYPHKVGKPAALKAFKGALRKAEPSALMAGLERYIATKPPDRNWCNPATWLNQERWLDQEAAVQARAGPAHWNDHGTQTGMSPTLERLILDEQCKQDCYSDAGTALLAAGSPSGQRH